MLCYSKCKTCFSHLQGNCVDYFKQISRYFVFMMVVSISVLLFEFLLYSRVGGNHRAGSTC